VDKPHDNCVHDVEHVYTVLVKEDWLLRAFQPGVVLIEVHIAASARGIILLQGEPAITDTKTPQLLAHAGFASEQVGTGIHSD